MIRTLDDAWQWYRAVARLIRIMRRMAVKYWDREELADLLGKDSHFRSTTATDIEADANRVLDDLEDLAVFVLFTVFEAECRDLARVDVDRLLQRNDHPVLNGFARELKDSIINGSFAKLTAAYRSIDVASTAEIDQIRGYRNWVAHGRRGEPSNLTNPEKAIERMQHYLSLFTSLIERGEVDAGGSPPGV